MIYTDIVSADGRAVPCLHNIDGNERHVAIVCHGFLSSKESSTALLVADAMKRGGGAALAFDFPAHGASAYPDSLSVKRCIDDLSAAQAYAQKLCPKAKISFFGSSFGAYIVLLHMALHPLPGRAAVLRSAAVNMGELFDAPTQEQAQLMAKNGWYPYDEGFSEPIRIYRAFLDELAAYDVYALYKKRGDKICMVHGEADDVVPIEYARRFACEFGAEFIAVPGDGHRLMTPLGLAAVEAAVNRVLL